MVPRAPNCLRNRSTILNLLHLSRLRQIATSRNILIRCPCCVTGRSQCCSSAFSSSVGCGSGPALILALSFMGLRARTHESAGSLSLLAQGVGYAVAGLGPVVFGMVHDHTGGWTLALLGTAAVALGMGLSGFGAGKAVKV